MEVVVYLVLLFFAITTGVCSTSGTSDNGEVHVQHGTLTDRSPDPKYSVLAVFTGHALRTSCLIKAREYSVLPRLPGADISSFVGLRVVECGHCLCSRSLQCVTSRTYGRRTLVHQVD